MDPLDGHQLHPALLQPVGEHGPKDGRRGGQHHFVRHEIHRVQVLVAHAQGDVAQLPLQPQLVHDGEGGRRVALERVAEDAMAVARGRSHQRFALSQALCHFPPVLLLLTGSQELRAVLLGMAAPGTEAEETRAWRAARGFPEFGSGSECLASVSSRPSVLESSHAAVYVAIKLSLMADP